VFRTVLRAALMAQGLTSTPSCIGIYPGEQASFVSCVRSSGRHVVLDRMDA
jgi:hypothetical protein